MSIKTLDIQQFERTEAQALQSVDHPDDSAPGESETTDAPSRRIYLFGEINEESSAGVIQEIHEINDWDHRTLGPGEDPEPILLIINSYGGTVTEALAIIDAMDSSPAEVHTLVTGKAFSSAMVIALAGAVRYVTRNSNYMWHSVQCGLDGGIPHLGAEYAFTLRLQKQFIKLTTERTNIPKAKLQKWTKESFNLYFSAKKAIKLGVADAIV